MSQVVELPAFTLKKGVREQDFRVAHEKFNREFMKKHPAYVSHKLLRNGESWFDLVIWKSEEGKNQAFKDIYDYPGIADYMSFIDQDGTDDDIPIFSVVRDYEV